MRISWARYVTRLHSQIKEDVYALIDRIKTIKNTEKEYKRYKSMLEKYVDGSEDMDRLEIAAAELMVLTFSLNSMRATWRNKEAYKKHMQEEKEKRQRKL